MDAADLKNLCYLAGRKEYAWLSAYLSNPRSSADPAFFSDSPKSLTAWVDKLRSHLAEVPELTQLFDLFLLTRYLLAPGEVPQWAASWLNRHIDIARHFPHAGGLQTFGEKFCAVPVVSVIDDACIRYFITGRVSGRQPGPPWPAWADPLLDDDAKKTIRTAAAVAPCYETLAPGSALFCFPLTVANAKCQFAGSSLGVALAIGFLSVITGSPISARLLATGRITGNGKVTGVGGLDRKLKCAHREGFSVFLRPDQDFAGPAPQDVEVLPVSDLSEAWLIAGLYAPGRGQMLLTLLAMLKDPRVFVNNLDHVDHRWIRRVRRLGKWQKIADAIQDSPALFADFVAKLDRVLESWDLEAAATLCDLITPQMFSCLKGISPLSAFRFCTLNLALNNHRGDVAAAGTWADLGRDLLKPALEADLNACADFLNNRYVTLHNGCTFEPELPPELLSILNCLEKRYAVQCEGGCFTDPVLGKLYGTIAQNFAFCGAKYLARCEAFIRRAVEAFGGGRVPEYKNQILREYCYLVYAYLDAGLFDEAQKNLMAYLEVRAWPEIRSALTGFGPFQHAILARFLADTGDQARQQSYYRPLIDAAPALIKESHPWQLWAFNMGRIALALEDKAAAAGFFKKSLEICLAQTSGPTMNLMALLPLSAIYHLDVTAQIDFQAARARVSKSAALLNPEHIKMLVEDDFTSALEKIHRRPETLFPFTYR